MRPEGTTSARDDTDQVEDAPTLDTDLPSEGDQEGLVEEAPSTPEVDRGALILQGLRSAAAWSWRFLLVVAAAQWAWFRWGAREAAEPNGRRGRAVPIVLAVLAIAVGTGTTVMVALIGDSGARAVWGGILG